MNRFLFSRRKHKCQSAPSAPGISRRRLLWGASLAAVALPGLGVIGCDWRGDDAQTPGPEGMEHGAMGHGGGVGTITPELIAAAADAKLDYFDPALPSAPADGQLSLDWRSQETALRIDEQTVIAAWTFQRNAPGPIVHCRVGDRINFQLTNESLMPHSMDFHAARIDPRTAFAPLAQGQTGAYAFTPQRAGAFLYHCGTPPALLHIGAGMYGAIIVSPRRPLPPAREFVLVQGEYYLTPPSGPVRGMDFARMLSATPDAVVFNGRPDLYMRTPIRVPRGQRVRFWVVNAGPTLPCAFHVVGEQFDTVYIGEPGVSAIHGVQTFAVPPGGGMGFELVCDIPGEFMFMNHAMAFGQKGAMGRLIVEG